MQNEFQKQIEENIRRMGEDRDFIGLSNVWNREAIRYGYASNFKWMGRPIIQVPQDIYAIQELVWSIKPDLIIETGIAHGGSLIMSASMLALLDYCDAVESGEKISPGNSMRKVVGVDIDIRDHNRLALDEHPLRSFLHLIEGSSIDNQVIDEVRSVAKSFKKVMVFLDSNHTHDHVLAELRAYSDLVSIGSYCVVWDSGVEDLPEGFVKDRPWGKGNNPRTAVDQFLRELNFPEEKNSLIKFQVDVALENKLAITASRGGFLVRKK